ncbi:MAG: DNA recombination protein RmuC [Deltaproteobacteria bacterium]|nr:DNA recombination protein RmuC [Deltaproteobacteria bacterium]
MTIVAEWLAVIFFGMSLVVLIVVWWIVTLSNRRLKDSLDDQFRLNRLEFTDDSKRLREEVSRSQRAVGETMVRIVSEIGKSQQRGLAAVEERVKSLTDMNEKRFTELLERIDKRLSLLQESNEKKLEQMRQTVDEKLQSTLEKRFGESFKLVSERLDAVQRGLGDMQNLATGVGDLKRMLTNVKTRGTWGEFQLGDILEQILTPDQFARNVQPIDGSNAVVEYAIRLPGPNSEGSIWLPIDAKFPQEDYQRLLDAAELGDSQMVEKSTSALLRTLKLAAQEITEKYVEPPQTTDFAIMFLPTEGLYSEVLRQPGLVEKLQQEFRVVVAGPTTLAALLNSLRMGFRTLAIEKRSSEVWTILSGVKTEFAKFGTVLERLKKQLETASNTIDTTGARTRAMARKLKSVEEMPSSGSSSLFDLDEFATSSEEVLE